jgi:hypothetical protein
MVCIFTMGLGANSDDDTLMHNLNSIYNKNYKVFSELEIHAAALCI